MARVKGLGGGLFRSILEIQDAVLTIPGYHVSFFPNSKPRAATGYLGVSNLTLVQPPGLSCWPAMTLEH